MILWDVGGGGLYEVHPYMVRPMIYYVICQHRIVRLAQGSHSQLAKLAIIWTTGTNTITNLIYL